MGCSGSKGQNRSTNQSNLGAAGSKEQPSSTSPAEPLGPSPTGIDNRTGKHQQEASQDAIEPNGASNMTEMSLETESRNGKHQHQAQASDAAANKSARRPSRRQSQTRLFVDYWMHSFEPEAKECLQSLRLDYCTDLPLSKRDKVMVMQGWNKALAFRTAFEEALLSKWRILVAKDELSRNSGETIEETLEETRRESLHNNAIEQVENNYDAMAESVGTRLHHMEELLTGMLDGAVRASCPRTQVVAREAYRPIHDDRLLSNEAGINEANTMHLECQTLGDYFRLFARCGVTPRHWVLFCDAFLWTMSTHVFYAKEDDVGDLERPKSEGAYSKFVAGQVAVPAIQAAVQMQKEFAQDLYSQGLTKFWHRISATPENKALIGEVFYRNLLTNYPQLLDYFASADMDSLAMHLVMALELVVDSIPQIGRARTTFRKVLDHLAEHHLKLGIPTYSYALVGGQLLDTLQPFFKEEEELQKDSDLPVTAKELEQALGNVYGEVMAFTYHPMLRHEKIYAQAEEFYEQVAEELTWSPRQLSNRLFEVKLQISSTGTYSHTSEELEIGARLAWRNSAKCVGRIAWNTLLVRDRRHIDTPKEIFEEVVEHLKIATGGTNIQSVMTVFKPRSNQTFGVRFWSSQFVRYACYKDEETGETMGDPANFEMTEYLIRRKLWTPPKPKSGFDVLPIVLKIPGEPTPYVFELPKDSVHEVAIEHPTCKDIAKLGLRWSTVPAISNFNMNLGGVDYQCMPFSGWFLSTEVVRNLLERYNVGPEWAKVMSIDTNEDLWKNKVANDMDTAILHSFRKHMYTVVDPVTCGKSFLTHVVRERETYGRECPAQWSWIGGFLGHTNDTWHLEMRDFWIAPQYEYCAEQLLLMDDQDDDTSSEDIARLEARAGTDSELQTKAAPRVKVLIAYGSETGNAEAVAMRLARTLRLLRPTILSLNEVVGLKIVEQEQITHLLCLCSTFGKGEPPQNAEEFFDSEIEPDTLSNTQTAVLALGSSLYPDFCQAGVQLAQKLEKAGKKLFVPLQKADSAVGAEGTIDSWCSLVKGLVLPPHLELELSAKLASGGKTTVAHKIKWQNEENTNNDTDKKGFFEWPQDKSCVCIENEELLEDGEIRTRSTRRIVFSLPKSMSYETGDHLCVEPLNSLDRVKRFASCFRHELKETAMASGSCPFLEKDGDNTIVDWQLSQPFEVECVEDGSAFKANMRFKTPATLGAVLEAHVDFALQSSMIHDLIDMIHACLQRDDRCSKNMNEAFANDPIFATYQDLIDPIIHGTNEEKTQATNAISDQYPTLVDFFEKFGPVFLEPYFQNDTRPILPLAEVLAVMHRLQPRYYSISSSCKQNPQEVSITVGVVHVTTLAGAKLDGVCSNYLARLQPNVDRAKISIRESTFRAPTNVEAPLVMIGPGTGLAPMMGFLQDRAHAIAEARKNRQEETKDTTPEAFDRSSCHLFFGCRTDSDRIYKETIEQYSRDGILKLHLALSREAPKVPKQYVQDKILDMGQDFCDLLLRPDTHYFICGDAKMADECYETCITVLRKYAKNMSRVGAVNHLKQMRAQDRWQFDLWGIVHQFQESRDAVAKMKKKAAKVWLSRFAQEEEE